MTEIETRIGHKTPPVSSAQEKPQESKQTATPPLGATEKRQEPVVSEDTVRDSTTAQEKPQESKQAATPPLGATEKREPVISEDTVRDSPTAREEPQQSKQTATPPSGATEKRQEPVVSEDTVRDSPTAREKPQESRADGDTAIRSDGATAGICRFGRHRKRQRENRCSGACGESDRGRRGIGR